MPRKSDLLNTARRVAGLLIASCGPGLLMSSPPAQAADGDPARGQALYMVGRLGDGSALQASRPGLPDMNGPAAACVQCHRRSGFGDQEGRVRVPPITASALLAPGRSRAMGRAAPGLTVVEDQRAQRRPAYTADTLRRALQHGRDPADQPLAPWMPRYTLSDQDFADLLAYLHALGPVGDTHIRGHDGQQVHVASIVTPEAPAERRQAVEALMPAWARQQRFGNTTVRWHLWSLTGAPSDWPAQLAGHLARQPVLAVVSGAGGATWAPIDAFCEARALPCLFPLIDQAPPATTRHYAAHFSEGPLAEARLAARALTQLQQRPERIALWFDSEAGRVAAQAFQAQAQTQGEAEAPVTVSLHDWRQTPAPGAAQGATAPGPQLVIGWLDTAHVPAWLDGWSAADAGPQVWLSAQMSPPASLQTPPAWRARLRWLSLRSDPVRFRAAAATGLEPWLTEHGLPASFVTPLNGEVYAAAFFFSDALLRTRGGWSADHLLERLEGSVNNRPPSGSYVRLSLGPGQRVAAQVGLLLGYAPPGYTALMPLSPVINANE